MDIKFPILFFITCIIPTTALSQPDIFQNTLARASFLEHEIQEDRAFRDKVRGFVLIQDALRKAARFQPDLFQDRQSVQTVLDEIEHPTARSVLDTGMIQAIKADPKEGQKIMLVLDNGHRVPVYYPSLDTAVPGSETTRFRNMTRRASHLPSKPTLLGGGLVAQGDGVGRGQEGLEGGYSGSEARGLR